MSTNQIEVSDLLADKVLAQFVAQQSFIVTANRDTQEDFVNTRYKPGNTVRVLRRNKFDVTKTLVTTPQPTTEDFDVITIRQPYSVTLEYNAVEATQYLDRYEERVIQPAMAELVKSIEMDIALDATLQVYQTIGTPGVPINSFGAVDQANVYFGEHDISITNSYMALNLRDASALKTGLNNNFNKTLNDEITFGSRLGYLSTFDIFQNSTIVKHSAGTAAGTSGKTINGTVSSGNTLVLSGLPLVLGVTDPNAIKVGDILALAPGANINSLSNLQRKDTGYPATFVIQSFTPSPTPGGGTVTVAPSIVTTNTPQKNISGPIPSGTGFDIVGTAYQNMVYDKAGLSLVNPPLQPIMAPYSETRTDEDSLLSINVTIEGDAKTLTNIIRFTALVGWVWHPQYALRLVS